MAVSYVHEPLSNFEVMVVDNSGDELTEDVVLAREHPFPVRYEVCRRIGKNYALNHGLAKTDGEWVLFLDDDVVVVKEYLGALRKGMSDWKSAVAFGGRVVPLWPNDVKEELNPMILKEFQTFAFCVFEPYDETGIHTPGRPVMEANMLMKRSHLRMAGGFDVRCGPGSGIYRMGTHGRLFEKCKEWGKDVVYLADAVVYHRIRAEQVTYGWLRRRAHSFGRSLAYLEYGARGIQGDDRIGRLIYSWGLRRARQLYFYGIGKEIPRRIAEVEGSMLRGVLYERLFGRY